MISRKKHIVVNLKVTVGMKALLPLQVPATRLSDFDEFPNDSLPDDLISEDLDVDFPEQGIMNWIQDLYQRSRGIELGTFGGSILSSAFKEQSSKWNSLVLKYISDIIVAIHRFLKTVLQNLCTDERLRDDIWSAIADEILNR